MKTIDNKARELKLNELFLMRNFILSKYDSTETTHIVNQVNDLIYDEPKHLVSVFKDYLLYDETSEFFKRFYKIDETNSRLDRIAEFYQSFTVITPNYNVFQCKKFFDKNRKKKQKIIDNMNKEEEDEAKESFSTIFRLSLLQNETSLCLNKEANDCKKPKKSINFNDLSLILNKENHNSFISLCNQFKTIQSSMMNSFKNIELKKHFTNKVLNKKDKIIPKTKINKEKQKANPQKSSNLKIPLKSEGLRLKTLSQGCFTARDNFTSSSNIKNTSENKLPSSTRNTNKIFTKLTKETNNSKPKTINSKETNGTNKISSIEKFKLKKKLYNINFNVNLNFNLNICKTERTGKETPSVKKIFNKISEFKDNLKQKPINQIKVQTKTQLKKTDFNQNKIQSTNSLKTKLLTSLENSSTRKKINLRNNRSKVPSQGFFPITNKELSLANLNNSKNSEKVKSSSLSKFNQSGKNSKKISIQLNQNEKEMINSAVEKQKFSGIKINNFEKIFQVKKANLNAMSSNSGQRKGK